MKQTRTVSLIVGAVLGAIYGVIIANTLLRELLTTGDVTSRTVALWLLMPHIICSIAAPVLNIVTCVTKNRILALLAGILYSVALVLLPVGFPFLIPALVLAFVGFSKLSKLERAAQANPPQSGAPGEAPGKTSLEDSRDDLSNGSPEVEGGPPKNKRYLSPLLVIIAVSVALVLLIGIPVLLFSGGGDAETAGETTDEPSIDAPVIVPPASPSPTSTPTKSSADSPTASPTDSPVEAPAARTPKPGQGATELTVEQFDSLLATEPLAIVGTEHLVQHDEYKSLYPDILLVTLQNNTDQDILDAVVAFVAWDENGLPVKMKGYMNFLESAYIKYANYESINLIPGGVFDESRGLRLDQNDTITTFKAMVVSYETFDGGTWESPYFDAFCALYEGQKLDTDATVSVEVR